MGFELRKLVREAAGALGTRFAETARSMGRRAHARAGRVWRDVGELLRLGEDAALAARVRPPPNADATEKPGRVRAIDPASAEPNTAVGAHTQVLVETMVEVLERSGYVEVHADVAGRTAPELVRGTVRSHRPSLAAVAGGCAVLVDVFVPSEMAPEEQLSRWHLFSSAAEQVGGEFHVVVPSTLEGVAGRAWTRRLAEAMGMSIHQVWEI
jgi:hypothetical protein